MVPFVLPHLERGLSGGKLNCPVDGENSTIPCSGSFVTFQSITWEEQSTFRPPQNPSSTFLPERSWRENSYLFTPADNSSCAKFPAPSARARRITARDFLKMEFASKQLPRSKDRQIRLLERSPGHSARSMASEFFTDD